MSRRRTHLAAGAAMAAIVWSALDARLLACPVCFRVEDGAVADGVRAAVLVLVGVTVGVLAVVGVWWARFARTRGSEEFSTVSSLPVPGDASRIASPGTGTPETVENSSDPIVTGAL